MNSSKDLLKKKKKSKPAIFFGICFLILALFWLPVQHAKNDTLSGFDLLFAAMLLLNSLSLIMAGKGYGVERLLGKAYIKINDAEIKIKNSAFSREMDIAWNEISAIDYSPGFFTITKKDHSKIKMGLTKLEYANLQEIKNVIKHIASVKQIQNQI